MIHSHTRGHFHCLPVVPDCQRSMLRAWCAHLDAQVFSSVWKKSRGKYK